MKTKMSLTLLLTLLSFTSFANDSFHGVFKTPSEGELPINYSRSSGTLKIENREPGKYNVTISSSTTRPILRDGELYDYNVYECSFDNVEFNQVDNDTLVYTVKSIFIGGEDEEVTIKRLDDGSMEVSNTVGHSAFCGIHATINGSYLRK